MQNHLFRRFPFGSFPAPARFFCPAPDVAAYILLPFSSSSLLFACSHRTSGTILFTHHSLNPFLYFHFTLQIFCIFIHNICSISLLICRLSKLPWPSKGRLAAWLDNDDGIVIIWSWYYIYWRQACLVMMIGKWQLTGAWCRTAYCPWPAVQPGASTSKYDNIHLKKYSTTLWDIFALNFVPLFSCIGQLNRWHCQWVTN